MDCSLKRPDAAIAAEWAALSGRALVPSGNNLPEFLMPAIEGKSGPILAQVRDSGGLQLAMPLTPPRFPFGHFTTISTPVSYFGMPHLGRDAGSAALQALLRHLKAPLLLHSVPVNGEVWKAIEEGSGYIALIDTWERALLRPAGSYAAWFESFERRRRKEYRRLQARLSEQGRYEALSFRHGDDSAPWVAQFIELEAAGWKGQRGTALKADADAVLVLYEAARRLAAAGKLRFWKLALDGKPIAMMYAVADGGEAWLGKIAFDEHWSKFSPGVLLILHATEQMFAEGIAQADSCAIPDHPMINHLWRDRLQVADVMIAGPAMEETRFNLIVNIERVRRGLRGRARNIFYKLTGRHRT